MAGRVAALLGLAATNRRELPTAALLRLKPLGRALSPPWFDGLTKPGAACCPR